MKKSKDLDQFYTNPAVAEDCYRVLEKTVDLSLYDLFLEPSAGTGSFLSIMPENKRLGLDLDPKTKEIKKKDFFDFKAPLNKKIIVIGNPPFGKRSKLSIDFFLKATEFSDTIAFIVPLQWRKWSVQSKIPRDWELVVDYLLPEKAFIFNDKPYGVRCSFQIWRKNIKKGLRLKDKPPTSHPDFEMYLYNNVRATEKYFDYDWDFAVPRQGYADYERRETSKETCEKTTQWIFFKAKDEKTKERLMNLDFNNLAMKNTSTPGWGKADVVELYNSLYATASFEVSKK